MAEKKTAKDLDFTEYFVYLHHTSKQRLTMQEYADYIVQIEIDSLWSGRAHQVGPRQKG